MRITSCLGSVHSRRSTWAPTSADCSCTASQARTPSGCPDPRPATSALPPLPFFPRLRGSPERTNQKTTTSWLPRIVAPPRHPDKP
jgi:hypothetical protein